MPIRPRPAKARGNQNYADEVAAGKPDILDVEVDLDLNTLYTLINGQLTSINLDPNAGILASQLHHPLGLDGSDLAPGAIVPTNSVNTPALQDKSVTAAKIGIAQTTFGLGQLSDANGFSIGTTEQLLAELVWTPASRGGNYLAIGRLSGQISGNANENVTITINLKSDGTAGAVDGSLLDQSIQQVSFTVSPVFAWSIPWSVTLIAVHGLSATSRMKLTGQTTAPVASGFGCNVHTRALRVWELA